MIRSFVFFSFVLFASLVSLAPTQMPDPRQMSGQPLPVGDLSPGTVTARVIRGQLSNPIEGQTVEVTGGAAQTSKTDAAGRATFTGLTPGATIKLRTTVGSETIESREFQVPSVGGIRVMLVATDPDAAPTPGDAAKAGQGAPVDGTVTFGPETRFVIEIGQDALNVFNMLQITNASPRPVRPKTPIEFDLPSGAVGVGMMEGSTPNAVAAGSRVAVNGPFPPGNTVVQFGYSLPLGDDTITIAQKLPIPLPQLALVVQKTADMQLTSAQVAQRREMQADGNTYIVGQGGPLQAGDTLTLVLSGLPSRPSWPRNVAVTLAVVILLAGVYGATRLPASDPSRSQLQNRREKLFAGLAALETARRQGAVDVDTYAARRESLVTALEDLYRGVDSKVRDVA
ncbi:MAG TPA: hypothetical protein VGI12_07185 [Vicinamibacterales bacterium]|jgi:hypothetical protein